MLCCTHSDLTQTPWQQPKSSGLVLVVGTLPQIIIWRYKICGRLSESCSHIDKTLNFGKRSNVLIIIVGVKSRDGKSQGYLCLGNTTVPPGTRNPHTGVRGAPVCGIQGLGEGCHTRIPETVRNRQQSGIKIQYVLPNLHIENNC